MERQQVAIKQSVKLTVRQAAEMAQVSVALVYQWCDEKRLPHYRFGGDGRRGRILINANDLTKFIEGCRVERHSFL